MYNQYTKNYTLLLVKWRAISEYHSEMLGFMGKQSTGKQNDLADYGNKYAKIGNKQLRHMMLFMMHRPLTNRAYDGGLLDKTSVQDLPSTFDFYEGTTFPIDVVFYSEEDMEIY